nr:immunoglobulin heavy chain junction region [Macaca mulatta]MPN84111.1 immunoglobulin heavy chain junction region [Macaca mulatta]MPN84126.1 immunoglobulin heavy chain junction region [Macaca mulatta]MPN84293.1 immunoglobulin heavy chain junction region [Macaca mulatta]MPN84791.1 immunoglobulin heavy chain junction region [Macaca mulatta]
CTTDGGSYYYGLDSW